LHKEGLDQQLIERLNIWSRQPDLSVWKRTVEKMNDPAKGAVSIALIGKYVHLRDAYKSLHEAITHGGLANDLNVIVHYVDSEELQREPDVHKMLHTYDAILVPGGFGDRGLEGKIKAVRYAREHEVPFFGICLGMQMAVVEVARHVCNLEGANTVEADPQAKHPLIHLMSGQRGIQEKGGTMRLGAYPCELAEGSLAARLYGAAQISERHRHRFEVNNEYRAVLERDGLRLSGLSPDQLLVEMIELPNHPFFIGCQFHPEFKSKPHSAHPLFTSFIRAAYEYARVRPQSEAEEPVRSGRAELN
jgi:CTP synthase